MYRKIKVDKYSIDDDFETIRVKCDGLKDFHISGRSFYNDKRFNIYGSCHASTRYLYNAFVSVFGKGYFDITVESKEEAYAMIDNFVALVDTMNAGFEEEEKLKQEKLKQYRKEYYQKQKAEKAKRNAHLDPKQRKLWRSTPQQPSI